jgi:hypothetical protein
MSKPRAIDKKKLDKIIAKSKQATADLMTVRREIVEPLSERFYDRRHGLTTDRLNLVQEECHEMGTMLHELWMIAVGLADEEPEILSPRAPRTLTNGQFRLTAGGRS